MKALVKITGFRLANARLLVGLGCAVKNVNAHKFAKLSSYPLNYVTERINCGKKRDNTFRPRIIKTDKLNGIVLQWKCMVVKVERAGEINFNS